MSLNNCNFLKFKVCILNVMHYFQETNVLGFKGPRKMCVIIPGMNKNHQRVKIATTDNYSSLLGKNLIITINVTNISY